MSFMGSNQPNNMGFNGFNPLNFMQQFNQFKNTFKGNPEEVVKNMLSSGQMSQEQFNKLSQLATQFQNMLRSR